MILKADAVPFIYPRDRAGTCKHDSRFIFLASYPLIVIIADVFIEKTFK